MNRPSHLHRVQALLWFDSMQQIPQMDAHIVDSQAKDMFPRQVTTNMVKRSGQNAVGLARTKLSGR
ncbi:MAG: hypothetical protein ACI88C_002837 [Acidimicrobiales bacterium]|jgi:hypothetical protein